MSAAEIRKLPGLKDKKKTIFVRTNEAESNQAQKDIEGTYSPLMDGYVIPKFEDSNLLEGFIDRLKKLEDKEGAQKTSLILMIESPAGVAELRRMSISEKKEITERLIGVTLGGEDYRESLAVSREISKDVLAPVRDEIVIFAHSRGILAIDTVFPDFTDDEGLRYELGKVVSLGFTSKLAIHPNQLSIINESFYPSQRDIDKAEMIMTHGKELEVKGAISIDGTMYDMPHLKWAKKLKKYIDEI